MKRIHIGKLIKDVFKEQHPDKTIDWFAAQLHCNRTNIYDIFKRPAIDTEKLQQISQILSHDFFADLSLLMHKSAAEGIVYLNTQAEHHKQILYYNLMTDISKTLNEYILRSQV